MLNDPSAQKLIETCLQAMRLRHLEQSQQLLNSLEALAQQQPDLVPWCRYLQGYLAFEIKRDWAEAERILTDLLQTELEPGLQGLVWYALGRSINAQGRWEEAINAFTQSLSLFTQLGQTTEKARAWKHIAISYYDGFIGGDFGPSVLFPAITYCQDALAELEPLSEPPPDTLWLKGSIWNILGLIYVSLGQWDDAIACYQQDLAICQLLNDRHGIGLTYGNLGEVYQKRGSWSEALLAYEQALSLIREFDNRYDEIEALANLAFLHQEMTDYDTALYYYSQTIQIIEQLRAGISSEGAQVGFFATVVDIYANMVLLCLAAGREAQAFEVVEQARSRAFLELLARRSPQLSQRMEATPMTLAEVQAALPPETLLLEYFTTGLIEAPEGRAAGQEAQRHRFPPARTLIFAITRHEFQVHEANISPNDLRPGQLTNVVERHFLQPQIRSSLYNRLITPVKQLLPDKHRLVLIPHGPLHYIPFQALLAPDGETLLRESGPRLVYAPSATVYLRYTQRSSGQAPLPGLALGYNSLGPTQLLLAEAEAQRVAQLIKGQALTGPLSKKNTLYLEAKNYRLLHFACHGEFEPEAPLASFLHLAPVERLTAEDVLNHLHLECDLVTLSACESGLSRVRRGDELVGLMRAFMYAGAPALVSTLWRVDDHSTHILMEKFYREVQAGTDFAEALKRAQLYLKNLSHSEKDFSEPAYWAAFILTGNSSL